MEREFLDQYERYDALELFVRSLGFSPGVVREVSVVPHTISVTLRTGPGAEARPRDVPRGTLTRRSRTSEADC